MNEEPEGARPWEMDGRRLKRDMEERREEVLVIDRRRWGERGAGEPGWTCAAHARMPELGFERMRTGWPCGMGGGEPGVAGRGVVGHGLAALLF
jgi:hypothetical protein